MLEGKNRGLSVGDHIVKNALQNIQPWKVCSVSLEKCQWFFSLREEPQASSIVLHQENVLSPSSRLLPKESIQPFGIGELCGATWLERLLFTVLPLGINVKKSFLPREPLCRRPSWTKHFRTERPPPGGFLSTDAHMYLTILNQNEKKKIKVVNKTNHDFLIGVLVLQKNAIKCKQFWDLYFLHTRC